MCAYIRQQQQQQQQLGKVTISDVFPLNAARRDAIVNL